MSGLQVIGVGNAGNDGTGDPLRTAFQKANTMFGELYGRDGVSVKDFGAAGDGETDDTAAFNDAIEAANGQSVVFVPSGTYVLTANVTLDVAGSVLLGFPGAVLKRGGIDGGVRVTADNCQLLNFEFDGNNAVFSYPTYARSANVFIKSSHNKVHGVYSHHSNSHGIGLDGQTTTCEHNIITGCRASSNNEVGIATNTVKYSKILHNLVSGNGYEGITVDIASQYNEVAFNAVDGNCTAGGVGGIGIDDATYNVIHGNLVKSTVGLSGITMQNNIGGCENNVLANNILVSNGAYGIQLKNTSSHYCNHNNITGNVFKSNTSGTIQVTAGCTSNLLSSNIYNGSAPSDSGTSTVLIPGA